MANPYELWNTRKSLGIMRATQAEKFYFAPFYENELRSTDEYIDFEKLPIRKRKLAPLVLPLARGRGVYEDSQRTYRFKPAYVKVEETIDPLMPLTFQPGLGQSAFDMGSLTPMQRLDLIRAAMISAAADAVERRWEHMRAKAIIDGRITLSGPDYPTTLIDFQRDSAHTVVLTSGNRFGDSGVSIVDFIQLQMDKMNNAEFGGIVRKIAMSSQIAALLRKDAEFLKHLDLNTAGSTINFVRGLQGGVENGDKVYQFGTMLIGGQSGATIELWVNDETYIDDTGATVRYIPANQMVFTGSPAAIMGYQAFGRIVDLEAQYMALPKFPKFFWTGDDVKVENLSVKSAPLMVPINPNATLSATVIA